MNLSASPDRLNEDQPPVPLLASFKSQAFRLFFESIEQKKNGHILDIGPVCGENINYFSCHIKKLSVCDMYFLLDQGRRKNLPFKQVLNHMVFSYQSFDGILFWDLVDRLEDSEVIELVEFCYALTKPGGLVMLFALGEQSEHSVVGSFVIKENFTFCLNPKAHLELPLKIRNNRQLVNILEPYKQVKSVLHPGGFREILIKR